MRFSWRFSYVDTKFYNGSLLYLICLMDDKCEGRLSFKTSDVVKNEVRDVIDGDRCLTVREVANKCITLECVTDCLMNLCVSVGVFPMLTQNFITALCSTLFENVVFSDEEGFIFKV
jgi:hypothetical protein